MKTSSGLPRSISCWNHGPRLDSFHFGKISELTPIVLHWYNYH